MASLSPTLTFTLLLFVIPCLLTHIVQAYDTYSYGYGYTSAPKPKSKPTPKSTPKTMMNPIDSCWRGKSNWAANRRALADCSVGFGSAAIGGKYGKIYTVTSSADDAANPKRGTLRYGVTRAEPLWIVFARDMVIRLENELIVNSFKTIDGRGSRVEIGYGPCLTIQGVSHVIVHGIGIRDCRLGKKGMVMSSVSHVGLRGGSDGDAITVFASSHVWIDHCSFSRSYDGLIDVVKASTAVTISNNFFSNQDKVMLLGHDDNYGEDKVMKVTIAFNRFGPGLTERMPRVRFGYAHVANNKYDEWKMYAMGGSSNPTIFSDGNYFVGPDYMPAKQVTKRVGQISGWKKWKWRSSRDVFKNGAYFVQSGYGSCNPNYTSKQTFKVAHGSFVPALTAKAGALRCFAGKPC